MMREYDVESCSEECGVTTVETLCFGDQFWTVSKPECGEELSAVDYCPYCGTRVGIDADGRPWRERMVPRAALEWHYARVVGRLRSWWWRVEEVWQRLTVGYAYVEVWNLNDYLAAYALPRLRHLREHGMAGHSEMSSDEWGRTLDEMIRSLDIYVRDNFPNRGELTEEEQAEVFDPGSRYRRGLRLFGDHWEALWD